MRDKRRIDADALILDRERRPVCVSRAADRDGPRRPEFDGIGDEVRQDLIEPRSIPDPDDGRVRVDRHRGVGAGEVHLEALDHLARERAELDLGPLERQLAALEARDVEQIGDERAQAVGLPMARAVSRAMPWGSMGLPSEAARSIIGARG